MICTPYEYQILDARRIHQLGGRCLLANEQGTGKSLEYLLYLHRHPEKLPAVVVCPASLKYNWEHEAAMHFGMRAEVLEGTRPPRRGLVTAPLYVVNYQILGERNVKGAGPGWTDFLRELNPGSICLDECQAISNLRAKQTRWVRRLCRGIDSVVALSGTPLTNRPAELFSVLSLLRPDLFPAAKPFLDRYCDPKVTPWGVQYRGATRLDELHKLLKDNVMIRRRKADVLKDLPPKTRSVVPLPLSEPREYLQAEKEFLRWLNRVAPEKVYRASRAQRLTQIGYLRRLCGQLKLPAVIEWVTDFLEESDGKLVLFAVHTEIIDNLCRRFKSCAVRVDGSTQSRDRQYAVQAFQTNPKVRLFVGNIDAAGKGLTLTASSTVAFAELPWTPGAAVQAEDRIHRISQVNVSSIYYLTGRGTIETRVAGILQDKAQVLSAVLDGGSTDSDLDVFDLLSQELLKR